MPWIESAIGRGRVARGWGMRMFDLRVSGTLDTGFVYDCGAVDSPRLL